MDHLDCLRCFVAVAELGGFAAGARRLGLSAPSASRAIATLEQRLGALLFQRSTRSVRLSEAGEAFLPECRRLLQELDEAQARVGGLQQEASGWLTITAPAMFGRLHMAPLALDFLREHPRLRLRTLFVNRLVHLLDEGVDVALRIAQLPDSTMTALQVGSLRRVLVASPDYLARAGEPRHPEELGAHRAIGFAQDGQWPRPWSFACEGGERSVLPQIDWVGDNTEVAVGAAVAGHGLARSLAYQVAEPVRQGRLRVLLEDFELAPVPVHLVYPAGRQAPAKLRLFLDFAARHLRELPVLQGRGLEAPA